MPQQPKREGTTNLPRDDASPVSQDLEPALAGHPGYMNNKADYLKRLRRISGQVRGIEKMVDDEQYCIDILTQVSAATKALQAVALGLLDEHMAHCVLNAAATGGEEADAKLREASAAISRLVRS